MKAGVAALRVQQTKAASRSSASVPTWQPSCVPAVSSLRGSSLHSPFSSEPGQTLFPPVPDPRVARVGAGVPLVLVTCLAPPPSAQTTNGRRGLGSGLSPKGNPIGADASVKDCEGTTYSCGIMMIINEMIMKLLFLFSFLAQNLNSFAVILTTGRAAV
ncbi:hypothetical protein F2P81_024104 [Scophthalmus maximus]|uniref:Uncharacterized protein n=1 Tax=Scophthalmus maximus TaxID=52904 RepID=A0A6A4RYH8_SCOMX|nr:hypothetical protein F2P81_024104 [Scophthalmus maximus]